MSIKKEFMAANIDPQKVAEIIREVAAQYVLPRFRALQHGDIQEKSGPQDLVTIADIEAEKALTEILPKIYPGVTVIGEEAISAGTADLNILQKKQGIVFVADPVDGTNNFVAGKETFCVMLACVIDGVTEHGWIYEAVTDRMLIASRGQGATVNGIPIHVAEPKALKDSEGYANIHYFPRKIRDMAKELEEQSGGLSTLRCSGIEYFRVATGEKDFSISAGNIKPWDHLVGTLAVQEAGGAVTLWNGHPYTPQDELGGLVVVSHQGLAQELQQSIIQKMASVYYGPKP
jgi:fructose-1,6-bisphosphatase/inositol monophosphatase family enzyme